MFLHTYARITRALRTHIKPLLVALMTLTITVPVLVWAGSANEGDVLTTFYPGDKIKAADVNGNFAMLQSELEALRATLQTTVPVGTVIAYAGENIPEGWLACDGAEVSASQYSALFATVGWQYGEGNQVSTFNLPDLRGRTPIGAGDGPGLTSRRQGDIGGAEQHSLSISEMPSHTHTLYDPGHTHRSNIHWLSPNGGPIGGGTSIYENAGTDETTRSFTNIQVNYTGSSAAHNIMQPYGVLQFIIKY